MGVWFLSWMPFDLPSVLKQILDAYLLQHKGYMQDIEMRIIRHILRYFLFGVNERECECECECECEYEYECECECERECEYECEREWSESVNENECECECEYEYECE